jgi:perosamine synthetase
MKSTYFEVINTTSGKLVPRRSIAAPNRLETRTRELLAALGRAGSKRTLEDLRDELRRMTGRKHVFFAASCRAAIARILSLLPHEEVVLPAYTCPVVKTAVQVAGKRLVYVDIAGDGLNATSAEFDPQAKPGRVLIPTHIYGFPTDVETVADLARTRGCVTIEDAAAALGVRRNGRALGTFGDFGVFSFERSKRFPAFRGAVIVVNNESLLDPAKVESFRMTESRCALPARETLFAMVYNAVTAPWLYGRVTLPAILRGYAKPEEELEDDVEAEKRNPYYARDLHKVQAALVLTSLKRLDRIRSRIAEIVLAYRNQLDGTSIVTFRPAGGDDAGLLRFPVAFPGRVRTDVLREALRRGLFLETNYERPLAEERDWPLFPRATWAARNIILLPLYARLTARDAGRMAAKIKEI